MTRSNTNVPKIKSPKQHIKGKSVNEKLRTIIILCPKHLIIMSKLVEYMHCHKSRKAMLLNTEWRKRLSYHNLSNPGRSGTQSKVSSPLTCTWTYFPQVYHNITPWHVPLRIVNIPESLKLILGEVVTKDVDAEEEAEVDVEEEENLENITPNT